MLFLGLLLSFVLGFVVLNTISTTFNNAEKVGYSFLIGIALTTYGMFFLNVIGILITLNNILVLNVLTIAILCGLQYKKLKSWFEISIKLPKPSEINFASVLVLILLFYVIFAIYQKALFWPVVEYDSVTGYDFMAKAIALEGKFNNSLNQGIGFSENARFLYPPLNSGSFAYIYLLGFSNSHLIMVLQFIFFLIGIYGLLNRHTSNFAAILLTLLICITPEMLSHAALSLTNLENAIVVSIGMIALYTYFKLSEVKYLVLGSLFMGFNMWSRTDGIAFSAVMGLFILINAYLNKRWMSVLTYLLFVGVPTLAWSTFVRYVVNSKMEALFKLKLHWDSEKFNKIISYFDEYYWFNDLVGPVFGFLIILFLINAVYGLYYKSFVLTKIYFLCILILSIIVYTLIYYQFDYENIGLTVEGLMNSSYKRGLFAFAILAWFYIGTNTIVSRFFQYLSKSFNIK